MDHADQRLIALYLEGRMTDDEFAAFQRRLRDDPGIRARLRAEANLESALHDLTATDARVTELWNAAGGEADESNGSPSRDRRAVFRPLWRAVAAVVALGILTGLLIWLNAEDPVEHAVTAALWDRAGSVAVVDSAGRLRSVDAGVTLRPGDKIRSHGDNSFATVGFTDGTRIQLVGETSIALSGTEPMRFTLFSGLITAKVARQPDDNPMVIETPNDLVEVLGTEFALETSSEHTDIHVRSGRVRLIRSTDGKAVLLSKGERALSDVHKDELLIKADRAPADTWEESFEQRLPGDWRRGEFVRNDLPAGSLGGVRNQFEPRWNSYLIDSSMRWIEGLFVVHADTHLHFTFMMEQPGWMNLFLLTRTHDESNPTDLFQYNAAPFSSATPDAWYMLSIPLSQWKRNDDQHGTGFVGPPPPSGDLVCAVSWSSRHVDRGLVIDRVWVTRGGPGKVEMTPLR